MSCLKVIDHRSRGRHPTLAESLLPLLPTGAGVPGTISLAIGSHIGAGDGTIVARVPRRLKDADDVCEEELKDVSPESRRMGLGKIVWKNDEGGLAEEMGGGDGIGVGVYLVE
ncbi:hypothetical protein Hypma_007051 [Hypsizygus marmoreus]|uniref:Uncharacterized protein n=1 Tax=Hypsizygus marmoreus TaxID=39966 RepID=A0A369KCF1_HYPMA|nr:hypothetical protein Hypma_007051 [Hypsizygus marmoreus]